MRHSIKKQIAIIFMAVMTGTIALCWIINNIFLEKFYIQNKASVLSNAYAGINKAASNGDITSEEFDLALRKLCDMYKIGRASCRERVLRLV